MSKKAKHHIDSMIVLYNNLFAKPTIPYPTLTEQNSGIDVSKIKPIPLNLNDDKDKPK